MKKLMTLGITFCSVALVSGGCATKKFVLSEIQAGMDAQREETNTQIAEVTTQIEENQSAIAENDQAIEQQGVELAEASKTARDAFDRAVAAGKLAEGKLLYETVLSDSKVRFPIEKSDLSDEAKKALADFAMPLADENQNVYIEIQGHTDSTGSDSYNMTLGEQRAEAVRRYLNQEHGFPLHRMSVISYGESEPAFDNETKDGREQNRRVVLVVLR